MKLNVVKVRKSFPTFVLYHPLWNPVEPHHHVDQGHLVVKNPEKVEGIDLVHQFEKDQDQETDPEIDTEKGIDPDHLEDVIPDPLHQIIQNHRVKLEREILDHLRVNLILLDDIRVRNRNHDRKKRKRKKKRRNYEKN